LNNEARWVQKDAPAGITLVYLNRQEEPTHLMEGKGGICKGIKMPSELSEPRWSRETGGKKNREG